MFNKTVYIRALLCYLVLFESVSYADSINALLEQRQIPYIEFAHPLQVPSFSTKSTVKAVHIEENHNSYTDPKKLMMRHAEAAAFSLFYSSAQISNSSIDVKAYDINPFVGGTTDLSGQSDEYDTDREIMSSILNSVTAISMSMNTNSHSRQSIRRESVEKLIKLWEESDSVFMQSAGNSGSQCDYEKPQIVNQQEFAFHELADTYAKVGSAIVDPSDQSIKIKNKSSCSGVDLVALNPYLNGLKYLFRPQVDEYRELLKQYEPELSLSRSEKFIDTLVEKRKKDLDEEGYMTNIGGNSFIAPAVAGYFAGMKDLCPQFISYDLLAGAFAFSRPVPSSDDFPTSYESNGTLPFNKIRSGFGYLDAKIYKEAMFDICQELIDHPPLKTIPISTFKEYAQLEAKESGDVKTIQFKIDDDFIIFRTLFIFESAQGGIPYSFTATSPSLFSINLKPANANWQMPSWGLGSTNGFFGTSPKGLWKISFDKTKDISKIKIKIYGVKKGGLTELIIDKSKVFEGSK